MASRKKTNSTPTATMTVVSVDGDDKHPSVGITWSRHDDGHVTDHRKRDEWDAIRYPELTDAENDEIRVARRAGFASMYPMFPSAQAQSDNTLKGARAFMKAMSPEANVAAKANAVGARKSVGTLKDTVDMSVITRTSFTCNGDDADVINDMYMALVRFLKVGSGDVKLVTDGGKVIEAYKRANTR